mgnify:CR=1 FL=1
MNYLFYLSIQTVPLGIAVALEFTGPLAVALFSSRRRWISILVGVVQCSGFGSCCLWVRTFLT